MAFRLSVQTSTQNRNQNMKKESFVLSILAAGFITMPSFAAQAGCCGADPGAMAGCSQMSGHESRAAQTNAVAQKLPQPLASVFDGYIQVQTALAKDSLEGVAESVQAIAKTVKDDPAKTFSVTIAQQADALDKAADLRGAREAFKALSQSLIEYVSQNPSLAGSYRQVHCSMADASWLQTGSTVSNPYMGKAMARCGEFVKGSGGGAQQDHSAHKH
jgi:hypothetical protein